MGALVSIASNFVGGEGVLAKIATKAPKVLEIVRAAAKLARARVPEAIIEQAAQVIERGRTAIRTVLGGCTCFAAGRRVATPQGEQAIQALHVGDQVLAEDPATGQVESEAVQAVIVDGVKPLLAVQLSDGSTITVTADHPFYVDKGLLLKGAGWLEAAQLWPGDRLRTASGADATVIGLRHNVVPAVVYTLTVARDHSFFVGSARAGA